MATYRDWPDGKPHTIPYAQYLERERAKAGNPLTLPAPPVGTYDPSIDYNASAAQRGFDQTSNDAQTTFEQGQQDYNLNLGDLTRGKDWTLQDLNTSEFRLNEDYGLRSAENTRQYGILGRQQAEGAAQRGVTSAGLLGKSNQVRGENQGRDQAQINLGRDRGLQDVGRQRERTNETFNQNKTRLNLGNARQFGGFNGQTILNPLTGQPEFGSLITGVTRAGTENTSYQAAAGGQRAGQAAANGYVSPLLAPVGGVGIGRTPLTGQQYQSGMLAESMVRDIARRTGKPVDEVARGAGIDPNTWQRLK